MSYPRPIEVSQVRLAEEIDTKTAEAGDTFHAITATSLLPVSRRFRPERRLQAGS